MKNRINNLRKLEGGLRIKKNKFFNKKPLFSIITIALNDARNIEETILSVINQTYKNFEYIVIDGGSTDGTLDIIKKYNNKIDYWVSEKDGGIYPAMNKGVSLANGEIINMMNCGDLYINNKVIKKISEYFKNYPEIYFVLGLSKYINNDGTLFLLNNKPMFTFLKPNYFNTISHQAFFYKKVLHDEFGFYNLNYKICADAYFMYQIYLSKKYKRKLINSVFSLMRKGGTSSMAITSLEHKRINDELFGRSMFNELLVIKYFLKKTNLGKSLYNKYLEIKNHLVNKYKYKNQGAE